MKSPTFDTLVVSAKLFCVFAGTSLLTLQTGLGQRSQSEKNPTIIQWVMVIGGSLGTGLTATGAFLSNAFGNYMNGLPGGTPPPPETKPLTPAKKPDTLVPE
jgi:hypothetical protein